MLINHGLWALLYCRVAHALHKRSLPRFVNRPLLVMCLLWQRFVEVLTGVELPHQACVVPGLYIGHFGCIIIHPNTVTGSGCNPSQGVSKSAPAAVSCQLSQKIAGHVRRVYALDVSDEIATRIELPSNCQLVLSDGVSIRVPPGVVDVAYSNQLMEHLHPDDAEEQLSNIHRTLKPNGLYICITPNRLCGPHDVSRGFEKVPTGFHLKEYDNRDLTALFRRVGFRKVRGWFSYQRFVVPYAFPMAPVRAAEQLLSLAPSGLRQRLGAPLIGVKFIGHE